MAFATGANASAGRHSLGKTVLQNHFVQTTVEDMAFALMAFATAPRALMALPVKIRRGVPLAATTMGYVIQADAFVVQVSLACIAKIIYLVPTIAHITAIALRTIASAKITGEGRIAHNHTPVRMIALGMVCVRA